MHLTWTDLKMTKLFAFCITAAVLLSGCNQSTSDNPAASASGAASAGMAVAPTQAAAPSAPASAPASSAKQHMIVAKFVDFSLGDAEHYAFEDKSGVAWEFGGNKAESMAFGEALPSEAANASNQGWGPNKQLVGKWFNITYEVRSIPQYQDGPMGDVQVIVAATAAQ
jgi:hypothetical protein